MRVAQVRLEEIAAETQRAFEVQGVVVSVSVSTEPARPRVLRISWRS